MIQIEFTVKTNKQNRQKQKRELLLNDRKEMKEVSVMAWQNKTHFQAHKKFA